MFVDDAHGLGVLGPQGRGSVAAAGLGLAEVPVLMATLGKALGVSGAFVAGSAELVEGLVQFARCYVYTTAMPPVLAAAAHAALRVARHEDWRREKLALLIAHFRRGAQARGLPLAASHTPIQPVILGSDGIASKVAGALREAGFLVPAIRAPTVPRGQARLRITLGALHHERDVERLLDALAAALAALPPDTLQALATERVPRLAPHDARADAGDTTTAPRALSAD